MLHHKVIVSSREADGGVSVLYWCCWRFIVVVNHVVVVVNEVLKYMLNGYPPSQT